MRIGFYSQLVMGRKFGHVALRDSRSRYLQQSCEMQETRKVCVVEALYDVKLGI